MEVYILNVSQYGLVAAQQVAHLVVVVVVLSERWSTTSMFSS